MTATDAAAVTIAQASAGAGSRRGTQHGSQRVAEIRIIRAWDLQLRRTQKSWIRNQLGVRMWRQQRRSNPRHTPLRQLTLRLRLLLVFPSAASAARFFFSSRPLGVGGRNSAQRNR